MPPTGDERAYSQALAEARLGRPLTAGERRIDLLGADADLAEGKRRLYLAIDKEKRRVTRAIILGQGARLAVTPEIVAALVWLYNRGRHHAQQEIAAAGQPVRRQYADTPPRLDPLIHRARQLLGGVTIRVHDAVAERGRINLAHDAAVGPTGAGAGRAVADQLAARIPGSLDAASRLVSSGFNAGLADVFEGHADLFSTWTYSAVMDGATCDECSAHDGEEYATLDEGLSVLPDFGPNPDCFGGERCRCRLVPGDSADATGLGGADLTGGPSEAAAAGERLTAAPGGVSADVGVTPFRYGIDNPTGYYRTKRFHDFEKSIAPTADRYGVTVERVERTPGFWRTDAGDWTSEPSVSILAHDGRDGVRAFGADLGKTWGQEGVALFTDEQRSDDFLATFKTRRSRGAVSRALDEQGLTGARFTPDGHLQIMGKGAEFVPQLRALADRLDSEYAVETGTFDYLTGDTYDEAIRSAQSAERRSAVRGGQAREGDTGDLAARPDGGQGVPEAAGQVVKTSDPAVAARALADGRQVELVHPDEVAVFLDDLAAIGRDAQARGDAAPVYDLGQVTVDGTNLFVQDSLDVPRIQMPQLKGHPEPGSPADALPRDKRGEVDVAPLFYQHLRDDLGVKITPGKRLVSHLRPTQRELEGNKVAGIMDYLDSGGTIEGRIPISRDGYIVDGHHRWAAEVARDYRSGSDARLKMSVDVIDQDIVTILREANAFAKQQGLEPLDLAGRQAIADPTLPKEIQDELRLGKERPQIVDQATMEELLGTGEWAPDTWRTVNDLDHLFARYPPRTTTGQAQVHAYGIYRSPQFYSRFQDVLRSGAKTKWPPLRYRTESTLPGGFAPEHEQLKALGFRPSAVKEGYDAFFGGVGPEFTVPMKPLVKAIDELIADAPPLERPTTFYRGTQTVNRIFGPDGPTVGESYTERGYTSVSADPGVAELFASGMSGIQAGEGGSAIIELQVPAGVRGMWARATGQDEIDEFTLARDTRIVVDQIEHVDVPAHDYEPASKQTYIYAHVEPAPAAAAVVPTAKTAGEGAARARVARELAQGRARPGVVAQAAQEAPFVTAADIQRVAEQIGKLNRDANVQAGFEVARAVADAGAKVTMPSADAETLARVLGDFRRAAPLTDLQAATEEARTIVVVPKPGEPVEDLIDQVRDRLFRDEFLLTELFPESPLAFKAVFERRIDGLRLAMRFENPQYQGLNDLQDLWKYQPPTAQAPSQPDVVTPVTAVELRQTLGETTAMSKTVRYYGVKAPVRALQDTTSADSFAGLVRAWRQNGRYRGQVALPGGGWATMPPPPIRSLTAGLALTPIDRLAAAAVYARLEAAPTA